MRVYSIEAGKFRVDGGQLYGRVPKNNWETKHSPDQDNKCELSLRCLLIEDNKHIVLIDTGFGDKQSTSFFKKFNYSDLGKLTKSLNQYGFAPEDITDVLLTHLHLDHAGGCLQWNSNRSGFNATFPNAKYHVSHLQWVSALNPDVPDHGSFLKENFMGLYTEGMINFIRHEGKFLPNIEIQFFYGHTTGMIIPFINAGTHTIVFCADLVPTIYHIPKRWNMAFDINEEITIPEKVNFLNEALQKDYILFFEHDPEIECCNLKMTSRGIRENETFQLAELS